MLRLHDRIIVLWYLYVCVGGSLVLFSVSWPQNLQPKQYLFDSFLTAQSNYINCKQNIKHDASFIQKKILIVNYQKLLWGGTKSVIAISKQLTKINPNYSFSEAKSLFSTRMHTISNILYIEKKTKENKSPKYSISYLMDFVHCLTSWNGKITPEKACYWIT